MLSWYFGLVKRLIIYLDESGDLGFDFEKKQPSRYFVIAVLVCKGELVDKHLQNAVDRTIKNKLGVTANELKGAKTELKIKTYFLTQLRKSDPGDFEIYAVIVDKHKLQKIETQNKQFLYNQISSMLLQKVAYAEKYPVTLILDKCKNKYEMSLFYAYLRQQIVLPTQTTLHTYGTIIRIAAKDYKAIDLFCWGVFRKYEQQDESWYLQFKEMIICE